MGIIAFKLEKNILVLNLVYDEVALQFSFLILYVRLKKNFFSLKYTGIIKRKDSLLFLLRSMKKQL